MDSNIKELYVIVCKIKPTKIVKHPLKKLIVNINQSSMTSVFMQIIVCFQSESQ